MEIFQKIANKLRSLLNINIEINKLHKPLNDIQKALLLDRLERYLLVKHTNPFIQQGVTKEFLRVVEIAIHSFCNRKCWFCANNSRVDRHSDKIDMLDEVFLKILNELARIEWGGY